MLSEMDLEILEMLRGGAKRGRKPGSRLCVLCKRVFISGPELDRHLINHPPVTDSNSPETRTPSDSIVSESADSPIVQMGSLISLPRTCTVCHCQLNTMSDAQSHLAMNPDCRSPQFKCQLCPKPFIWPATLMKHFREQHMGPEGTTRVTHRIWFFCDICDKPLLSKHALALHKNKFHAQSVSNDPMSEGSSPEGLLSRKRGRKPGTRVCRLCKKTFSSTNDYLMHHRRFHGDQTLLFSRLESGLGDPKCVEAESTSTFSSMEEEPSQDGGSQAAMIPDVSCSSQVLPEVSPGSKAALSEGSPQLNVSSEHLSPQPL